LLISAGRLFWINGWVCTGLILAYQILNIIILNRLNPELLNKRGKLLQEGTKRFDKIFVVFFLILAYLLPIIAGLDAVRFQWSSMWYGLNLIGGIVFTLAYALGIWAMAENAHFEMTVFVEADKQQVCMTGPYKIVRHPGYVAEVFSLLGVALILGSWFSFIPGGALICLFVIRTALEDATLQKELPGYKEYATKTRFRLIPYIW